MLLQVHSLQKAYKAKDGQKVPAVRDIRFELEQGDVLAFLGPNGAGKTTTIKMIAGLIEPDAGEIFVDELPALGSPHLVR